MIKSFLKKIIGFAFILQLPLLIEAFLPLNTFTYDTGLSLAKRYFAIYGQSFPNNHFSMNVSGGLAPKTKYQILKKNEWFTDKLGYRNNEFIANPDVVLIGDSQIHGAQLDQNEIFSTILMKKTGLKIYNIAPDTPKSLEMLVNDKIIQSPKIVIFEQVERIILDYKYDIQPARAIWKSDFVNTVALNPVLQKTTDLLSKYIRNYSTYYLKSEIMGRELGKHSVLNDSILFYQGKDVVTYATDEKINTAADEYQKLNNYYRKKGIRFAFLPYPNKETIYFEHVPFVKQPILMQKFINALKKRNVDVIASLELLNNSKKEELYYKDDSHWSAKAVELISDKIVDYINISPSKK